MLQIPEDAVDEAMLALMWLGLGNAVDGVAMAAVYLISERRRAREEAAREQLAEQAVIEEVNDDDEDQACALVGLPQVELPREPAAARGDPIARGQVATLPSLRGEAWKCPRAAYHPPRPDGPPPA